MYDVELAIISQPHCLQTGFLHLFQADKGVSSGNPKKAGPQFSQVIFLEI